MKEIVFTYMVPVHLLELVREQVVHLDPLEVLHASGASTGGALLFLLEVCKNKIGKGGE